MNGSYHTEGVDRRGRDVRHGRFKIVLRLAMAVPGLPRDVVSRSGIGSADLIMKYAKPR